MKMIAWIRSKIRSWILDGTEQPKATAPLSFDLECLVRDRGKTLRAVFVVNGAVGLRLVGARVGDPGTRMIGAGEAVDQSHFWRLWRHFSPRVDLTWEDGAPADINWPNPNP